MNNVYLQERLVELKQQELQRELEQARLLREAGVSRSNMLARAAGALRNLWNVKARSEKRTEVATLKHQPY